MKTEIEMNELELFQTLTPTDVENLGYEILNDEFDETKTIGFLLKIAAERHGGFGGVREYLNCF